jgi:hypothetical protein
MPVNNNTNDCITFVPLKGIAGDISQRRALIDVSHSAR